MRSDYVQFGCGTDAPSGWRNFDAGPIFWMQKYLPFSKSMLVRRGHPDYPVQNIEYADVTQGLPLESQSVQAVYCSHVLEHLSLSGFRRATRNVFEYLKPGGLFRLVVPDLEYLINQYKADTSAEAASNFIRDANLGEFEDGRSIESLPRMLFGRSRHLWMWDYRGIEAELSSVGFVDIRRAQYNDSAEDRFKEVENPGRWENCLGVECRRPNP